MDTINMYGSVPRPSSGRLVEDNEPGEDQLTPEQVAAAAAAAELEVQKTPEELAAEAAAAESGAGKTQEEIDAEAAAADADADENAGLSPEEIEAKKAAETELANQQAANQAALELRIKQDLLRDLGIDDEATLKERLAALNNKPETEEEKAARIEKEQGQLLAFAIENKHVTAQDIAQQQALSSLSDQDIAFNSFKEEYMTLNKGRTIEGSDVPDPVTEQEIKEEFESLYHINSSSSLMKSLGEKQITKFATDTRNATQQKFDHAKQLWEVHQHKQVNVPAFQTFLKDAIAKGIPAEITVPNGDDDFVFKTQDATGKPLYDMAKIEALFVNDQVYKSFVKDGNTPELREYVAKEISRFIEKENRAEINRQMKQVNFEAGTKKGVKGAAAPFEEKPKPQAVPAVKTQMTPEQQKMMASRYGNPIAN